MLWQLQMPGMVHKHQQTVSVGSKHIHDWLVSHARPAELIFSSGSEIYALFRLADGANMLRHSLKLVFFLEQQYKSKRAHLYGNRR